jgi:hypothetical protein
MKHLKFFEQLYSEITQDETSDEGIFDDSNRSNSEDFTEKEINDIRYLLGDLIYDHENVGSCRALFHNLNPEARSIGFTKGFFISITILITCCHATHVHPGIILLFILILLYLCMKNKNMKNIR